MKTKLTLKKRVSLYFSLLLLAGLAGLQGVAEATAVMPEYDRLTPLTDKVQMPTDVAVDQFGRSYIAESTRNRVTILSQSGKFSGKVLTVNGPISIAVDAGGRILVGSSDDGSVSVFGPGLGFQFKLGSGNGEFGKPSDIAIDSTGKIYVVDKSNDAIRIYNSNGALTGSIGTSGNALGQLHRPISMAIDENAGEIVVLDQQQIYDSSSGRNVDGVRIQYFDMNGNGIREYAKFGYNCYQHQPDYSQPGWWNDPNIGKTILDMTMGELNKPKQIAVDALSRLYVTDAHFNKVMVFDNYDQYLGTIDSTTTPLRSPLGITMGKSSKLYVAAQRSKQVAVFGVDEYTALITTPSEVTYTVYENGDAPPAQTVTIQNLGKADISWEASTDDAWISFDSSTGTVLAGAQGGTVDISVNPDGFTTGEYTGSAEIDTGAGAAESIKVVLKVNPNPLQVSPGALDFEATAGTTADGKELTVTTATGVNQLWDVDADQPWISLNKTTGMTPDTIRVYVDTASLALDITHDGIITFTNQDPDIPAVTIPVSLVVTESTGDDADPGDSDTGGKDKWNKKWTVTQVLPGTALNGVGGTSKTDGIAVGDNGAILHFDGKDWTQVDSGTSNNLNSVWSDSPTNSYAVGAEGLVLNFNGTSWAEEANTGDNDLQDIWGIAGTNMYIVDEFGTVLDNSFAVDTNLGVALRSISGSSDSDVYAVGEAGAVYRYDGTNWSVMSNWSGEWLNGVWANSETDVVVVGENGTIVQFDGTAWAAKDSGTTLNLNGVCGFDEDDLYAVGDNSLILHYDGKAWSSMNVGAEVDLNDIWCTGKGDIIAVGDEGTIVYGNGKKFNWNPIIQQIVENAKMMREKEAKEKEAKEKENKDK